jgi:hypothetical protein
VCTLCTVFPVLLILTVPLFGSRRTLHRVHRSAVTGYPNDSGILLESNAIPYAQRVLPRRDALPTAHCTTRSEPRHQISAQRNGFSLRRRWLEPGTPWAQDSGLRLEPKGRHANDLGQLRRLSEGLIRAVLPVSARRRRRPAAPRGIGLGVLRRVVKARRRPAEGRQARV